MKVLWTCSTAEVCGPDFINQALGVMNIDLTNTIEARLGLVLAEHPRYLLAALARPEGDVHVAVLAADISDKQRPGIYVLQVEGKPMDQGMTGTKQATPVAAPPLVIQPPVPAKSKASRLSSRARRLRSKANPLRWKVRQSSWKANPSWWTARLPRSKADRLCRRWSRLPPRRSTVISLIPAR